jgi:hypothetical protein
LGALTLSFDNSRNHGSSCGTKCVGVSSRWVFLIGSVLFSIAAATPAFSQFISDPQRDMGVPQQVAPTRQSTPCPINSGLSAPDMLRVAKLTTDPSDMGQLQDPSSLYRRVAYTLGLSDDNGGRGVRDFVLILQHGGFSRDDLIAIAQLTVSPESFASLQAANPDLLDKQVVYTLAQPDNAGGRGAREFAKVLMQNRTRAPCR